MKIECRCFGSRQDHIDTISTPLSRPGGTEKIQHCDHKRIPEGQGRSSRSIAEEDQRFAVDEVVRYKRSKKAMSFPIVGIGASAGGLESFCELIARIPAGTGMAYVFVRHLDPRRGSLLVTILSKRARFPVEQAREDVQILPDHLYVIAPNTTLTIDRDALHLRSRDPAERPHRPVDVLFHSLAQQRGPNALALFSLGAGPTEQKVFNRSNKQVESLSRRMRVLLPKHRHGSFKLSLRLTVRPRVNTVVPGLVWLFANVSWK